MQLQWENDIRSFEEADRTSPPPQGAVLFVGSSSIALWRSLKQDFPSTPVINRGFGGSEMADALRYADRIIIPYKPRLIVLYAGDNDLAAGKTPAQVVADYRNLVAKVHRHLPAVPIAFIAIKPSPCRRHLLEPIHEVNAQIRALGAQDSRLLYIDVFTPMLDAGGETRPELFIDDGLHLNAAGYALWTRIVAPYLK